MKPDIVSLADKEGHKNLFTLPNYSNTNIVCFTGEEGHKILFMLPYYSDFQPIEYA
jgi:hypothetical protein